MSLDNILKIVLAGGSLTAGAFLTALRAKLTNTKERKWIHVIFYLVAGFVIIAICYTSLVFGSDIVKEPANWFAIVILIIALVFSLGLIWVTYSSQLGKYQYTTEELDPIVNNFSRNADKQNIKLLAGNLDFFGSSTQQMDKHPQYTCLRTEAFREIQILCTEPVSNEDKIRYGKIITDFPTVTFKYYKPSAADLKVRGRIKTLNNVTRLLIYTKVVPGKYEALELDTADSSGALYSHLWNLLWELAATPVSEELLEYRNLYRK